VRICEGISCNLPYTSSLKKRLNGQISTFDGKVKRLKVIWCIFLHISITPRLIIFLPADCVATEQLECVEPSDEVDA